MLNIKNGIYCGSFDPVTVGHLDVVKRAAADLDKVYISIGRNSEKTPRYTLDQRMQMWTIALSELSLQNVFLIEPRDKEDIPLSIQTVDLACHYGCGTIVRGVRNHKDYECEVEYEQSIFDVTAEREYRFDFMWIYGHSGQLKVSSTMVVDKITSGCADQAEPLLSPGVYNFLKNTLQSGSSHVPGQKNRLGRNMRNLEA